MGGRRTESGGGASKFASFPRWQSLLLVTAVCLAFIVCQERSAHATYGFSATGGMNAERQNHTATVLDDGRVLITGGATGAGVALNTAEIYNPLTGISATVVNTMTVARQSHTATKLTDGRVLIIGGNAGSVATAEIFDLSGNGGAGAFTATGSMSTARWNFTSTLLNDGTVLIAGGTSGGSSSTLDTALIYDPVTGTFSATAGVMSFKRRSHTATLLGDGRVLIAGGLGSTSASINSAEIYNPATGVFNDVAASMSSPRDTHAAVLLTDNRVLLTGGNNGSAYLATAEIFDPGAGTFTATANSMTVGHVAHTATRLLNGKVLIAGGYASFAVGVTNAGDVFTPAAAPATGSFSSGGTMTKKRAYHSAVPLNDGSVLLAGGTGESDSLVTAELYNPAAIAVSPTFKIFQDTLILDPDLSGSQSFTISNSGPAGVNLSAISIAGSDFTLSLGTCSPLPHTLGANGGNCSVSVTFNPASVGMKSTSIVIASNDPEKPTLSVPLSGKAITFISSVVVSLAGTGFGSVHSSPAGIACISGSSANCQSTFDNGSLVTLTPAGDGNSVFGSWSCTTGDCSWLAACSSPGDCIIEIGSNVSASATFNYVKPAKIHGTAYDFTTLMDAYSSPNAVNGSVIDARAFTFGESHNFTGNKLITITGGYDLTYSSNSGFYSVVSGGAFTIGTGCITLSNMIIQ